jgi:DNA-binding MarR family transcriptional regulator
VEDKVADVLRQWRDTHPDLDTTPIAVIGRINRCAALLQQLEGDPLAAHRLGRTEFDILTTLYRLGTELTPGRIAKETFVSGAAITKRLRGLEERGLVRRRPDERDRRMAWIALTGTGHELVRRLLPEQLAHESALLAHLAPGDVERLSATLSRLLALLQYGPGAAAGRPE